MTSDGLEALLPQRTLRQAGTLSKTSHCGNKDNGPHKRTPRICHDGPPAYLEKSSSLLVGSNEAAERLEPSLLKTRRSKPNSNSRAGGAKSVRRCGRMLRLRLCRRYRGRAALRFRFALTIAALTSCWFRSAVRGMIRFRMTHEAIADDVNSYFSCMIAVVAGRSHSRVLRATTS